MIDCSIKSKEYYNELKKLFNKEYNTIYKTNYAPKSNIGDCSYLYSKYRPTSYEDFFMKYVNDFNDEFSFEEHKGCKDCGRSLEQFTRLAECYYNDIEAYNKKRKKKNNVTIQMCFDDLFNHVIIETFDGKIVERFLADLIRNSSDEFLVEECYGNKDSEYGADIIVRKVNDPKYVRYLQVKPNTFFMETKNKSLIEDRKNAIRKEYKLKNNVDYKGSIEYVIYDRDALFLSNDIKIAKKGNKTKFKITDLIFDNGSPKFDILYDFNYEIPGKQKETK